MDLGTFVFVFPRISLHMLGGAVAVCLVQRDLDRAVGIGVFVGMTVLFDVVFPDKTPKSTGGSFPKIPTSLCLSKAV